MAESRHQPPLALLHLPQRRRWAWALSVALHAGALGILLWLMQRTVVGPAPEPERMVFVEPAPAPPLPLGAVASAPAAPVVPEPVIEPPKEIPKPQRLIVPRRKAKPAPTPAPVALPPGNPQGSVGGVIGGALGGEAGGQVGGVVGGRGNAPIPVDKVEHPPVIISRVIPDYPPMARARGLEGRVVLRAVVDRQGRVEEAITVVDSVPPLDAAAVDALRRWRFQPGRDRNEQPVRVLIDVPMRFQLR